MRAQMQSAFTRAAGGTLARRAGRRVFRRRLRVLAYHEVTNPTAFEAQVAHLAEHYTPVPGQAVVDAFRKGAPLPADAVWVTFDDGHRSIVDLGQPVLDRFGVPATMFLCPGMVETGQPFWWTVVRTAIREGLHVELDGRRWDDESLASRLKRCADGERRRVVTQLADDLGDRDVAVPGEQLASTELGGWLAAGHEVGNHSWDHPCLDRCIPEEQVHQVRRADEWLRSEVPGYSPVFAYPNGNWSPVVEEELGRLGYTLAVGFDHRLDRLSDPLRVSRLRVDADAPLPRFSAIVSGLHAAAFHLLSPSTSGAQELGRVPARTGQR